MVLKSVDKCGREVYTKNYKYKRGGSDMGLFGKKIPDGIRVVFYEGDLEGFQCNFASQLLLMDDVLRITKINP